MKKPQHPTEREGMCVPVSPNTQSKHEVISFRIELCITLLFLSLITPCCAFCTGTSNRRTALLTQTPSIRIYSSPLKSSTEHSVRESKFTSRSVAAESILDDKRSQSTFPLQRLENNPSYLKLDQRDRSFARFLVATTERRMGQIDKILNVCQREAPANVS
jgi:hypothetical protein